MDENLKILDKTEDGLLIAETKQYVANKQDIVNELTNIKWQKEDLLVQNKNIQARYKALLERERIFEEALKRFESTEKVEEIPTLGEQQ